jgi:diguanylate cyclase (GGDEF)-like protein/PAS domain S-box-containing protein
MSRPPNQPLSGTNMVMQHPRAAAVVVFLVASFAGGLLTWQSEQQRIEQQRTQVANMASDHAHAIQRNIEHALSATYALAALVRQGNGHVRNFEATAKQMLPFYKGAASMQLAPGGVVLQVVPLAGNEKAIGHDLLADPQRNKEAFHARETGQLTLAGPFELVQGGLGAVGRLPVYLGDDKQSFWGFTSVLIRFPQVLDDIRLKELAEHDYAYELWRIHPDSGAHQNIAASGNSTLSDPVHEVFDLPNGQWTLSVAPRRGWSNLSGLASKSVLVLLFSFLLAYLAKLLVKLRIYKTHLEDLVTQRTHELATSELRFRNMSDAAGAYLWEIDLGMVYTYVSGQSLDVKGYAPTVLLGHTPMEFMPAEDIPAVGAIVRRAIEEKSSFRLQHRDITPAGEVSWEEVYGAVFCDENGQVLGLRGTGMSINARKAAEARIMRLTNLYAALSECNQAIVHSSSEAELFPLICNAVVKFGGMRMAWIGLVDESRQQVRPAASCGDALGYLDDLSVSTNADDAHGRGPVGTAIRENRPVWTQDFLNDPLATPWHARAAEHGWRAVAALPLQRDGKVVGSFNLYAGEVHAFDEDARRLLEEMADDISFALDGFDRKASLKLAAEVFEQGKEGIMITDTRGNIVRVNHAFSEISGYSEAEALGQNAGMLSSERQSKAFYRRMWQAIDASGHWQGEIWNRRKDGQIYLEWLAISRVLNAEGTPSHYVGIFSDITQHKEAEARIQRLAHFDALTGLPNRTLLNDRARHTISMAQRNRGSLAVLCIDLDHFKNINDTLGHGVGDELLIEIAKRLRTLVREEDTLSRQGGDEFIVVLPGADADGAARVAEKLLAAVAVTCKVDTHELVITPSIGIAMYPSDGEEFGTLSKCADTAMYRAKQSGRNTFCFFTPEMQEHSVRRLQLEGALRHALERNELQLHYQPQIALHDDSIVGAEALLRWQHPELGAISPAEFIPIAEESGLILSIGEWVLRTAVRQMKAWLDAGIAPTVIAVNLSAVQFRQAHLSELIEQILGDEGLPSRHLELELTEGVAMDDPLVAITVMDDLHARGIRMAIDDFGTGYSSLSYLKRFQVYKLKIDQSFVRDITTDPEDKAIVSAVIRLAEGLGLRTIAEGVETEEQLAFLRAQGCQEVQGYFYSRPLPATDFAAFARARKSRHQN